MTFNIKLSLEILERTPIVIRDLLAGLSPEWIHGNEGENTWSPHEVVGHLIHSEETNWIPRVQKILGDGDHRFEPFDRFAQLMLYKDEDTNVLIDKFSSVRKHSLHQLSSYGLEEKTLAKEGVHPDLGNVKMSQLLAAWTVHDLDHINQITRVIAKQYSEAVGPWYGFLGVLKRPL